MYDLLKQYDIKICLKHYSTHLIKTLIRYYNHNSIEIEFQKKTNDSLYIDNSKL